MKTKQNKSVYQVTLIVINLSLEILHRLLSWLHTHAKCSRDSHFSAVALLCTDVVAELYTQYADHLRQRMSSGLRQNKVWEATCNVARDSTR